MEEFRVLLSRRLFSRYVRREEDLCPNIMSHSIGDEGPKLFSKQRAAEREKTLKLWKEAFVSSGADIKSVLAYYLYRNKQGKQHRLQVVEGLRKSFQEKPPKHEKNLKELLLGLENLYKTYVMEEDKVRVLMMLVPVFTKAELAARGFSVSKDMWDKARKALRPPVLGADGAPVQDANVEVELSDEEAGDEGQDEELPAQDFFAVLHGEPDLPNPNALEMVDQAGLNQGDDAHNPVHIEHGHSLHTISEGLPHSHHLESPQGHLMHKINEDDHEHHHGDEDPENRNHHHHLRHDTVDNTEENVEGENHLEEHQDLPHRHGNKRSHDDHNRHSHHQHRPTKPSEEEGAEDEVEEVEYQEKHASSSRHRTHHSAEGEASEEYQTHPETEDAVEEQEAEDDSYMSRRKRRFA